MLRNHRTTERSPADAVDDAVLSVRSLTVEFGHRRSIVRPVDELDLDIGRGETVALVGESGCGKTLTALALLGLSPPGARVRGRIEFDGAQIDELGARQMTRLRGGGLAMIFQEPVSSLNPVMRVGHQLGLALRAHQDVTRREARERAVELLGLVGIAEAERRIDDYPHQWSGGMCQRAMIALAVANRPTLLIADEPTTSLDVTVQAQVLEVLRRAQTEAATGMLLITHDLGIVAETADRVAVMYAGRIVERGDTADVLSRPQHPYTVGLLECLPDLRTGSAAKAIPGQPPDPAARPAGCAFHPRCEIGRNLERCRTERPELVAVTLGRQVACHEPGSQARRPPLVDPIVTREEGPPADSVLRVEDLVVRFTTRRGRRGATFEAVRGVSFDLAAGRTLGLVGESGCGKSTVAASIVKLLDPTSGRITFEGRDLRELSGRSLREVRRGLQIVFQDPHAALDPRMTIGVSVGEPLRIHGHRSDVDREVARLLDLVGIPPSVHDRYPHEFSGGQLQRLNIARALALDPRVLVLDEPVSSLDVSVQAQILDLLAELQQRLDVAYLFISHDLSVVRQVAHEVAVMYLGAIVEIGDAGELFRSPAHPYTRSLIDAVPRLDGPGSRRVLTGDVPSPISPPSGCAFRTRCWLATDECATVAPTLESNNGARLVRCHHPLDAAGVSG